MKLNPDGGRGRLGSLADLPAQTLVLTVAGRPIPQGSVSAPAAGVIKRESGPELHAWRRAITAEAKRVCGPQWVPANAPVTVTVCLTVPPPKQRLAGPTWADGYRDIDKLVRAVNDALCPAVNQFRVLASDMRVVTQHQVKTYPQPFHTHPLALPHPGVVIVITAATEMFPMAEINGDWYALSRACQPTEGGAR